MIHNRGQSWRLGAVVVCATLMFGRVGDSAAAPLLVDPGLQVTPVVSGLTTPPTMAFPGPNDLLVLEKATRRVQRVTNGVIQGPALDLAVNSASERGLLGIALDPSFATNQRVYLYWTQSSTGVDSTVVSEVPLLGSRVDRFVWNGSSLAFDANLVQLRALQQDSPQPPAGNHNGGVLRFGPDGKLYVVTGDVGRRGQLQNLPGGSAGNGTPDDAFGGPAPDNAHFTGVVLRLNPDGSAPADNSFFAAGAAIGGEVGANSLRLLQPVRHAHLAVHRCRGRETLLGLLALIRLDVALGEVEVAMGHEGAHATTLDELERIAIVLAGRVRSRRAEQVQDARVEGQRGLGQGDRHAEADDKRPEDGAAERDHAAHARSSVR
jgi:Glucose / Sorbosone dehydrogenase